MKKLFILPAIFISTISFAQSFDCSFTTELMWENKEIIKVETVVLKVNDEQKLLTATNSDFPHAGISVQIKESKAESNDVFKDQMTVFAYFHKDITSQNGKPKKSGDFSLFASTHKSSGVISSTTYVGERLVQVFCKRL